MSSRTLKFRAWDKEKEKMFFAEGERITFDFWYDGGWELCEHQLINHGIDNHPLIITDSKGGSVLMQFTGLLDKNGKEIYEGDIVKGSSEYINGEKVEGEILFANASFIIQNRKGKRTMLYFSEKDEFEILGNVWENPGLLTHPHA